MNARVCVWAGMEGGKKIKESGEGILVSRTELPQGPLGNYREVAQPHQLLGSSSLVKFRSCRLRLPLVSFCVQIIDCLHLPPCICCMLVLPILSKDLYFQCILYKTSSLKPSQIILIFAHISYENQNLCLLANKNTAEWYSKAKVKVSKLLVCSCFISLNQLSNCILYCSLKT